jgi:hypothetical protein
MKRYFQDKPYGKITWKTSSEKVTRNFPFHLDIPLDERDRYVTLKDHESLFSLAHTYLGDEHLWWIFIVANKKKNWRLPWDAQTNDTIRIPALARDYVEELRGWYINEMRRK